MRAPSVADGTLVTLVALAAITFGTIAPRAQMRVCASTVGGRTSHSLAYDGAVERVVMFGGESDDPNDPYPSSLWAWDGERWTCISADGPPGRADAFLAYDASRGRLVMFGGRRTGPNRENTFYSDTWEWDGRRWARVDTAG